MATGTRKLWVMRVRRILSSLWCGAMAVAMVPDAVAAGTATQTVDAVLPTMVVLAVDTDGPRAVANSGFSLVARSPEGRVMWASHDSSETPALDVAGVVYTLSLTL